MLLAKGANVNVEDKQGERPITFAIEQEAEDSTVKALLDHGAELNFFNSDGVSPLHIAAGNNAVSVISMLVKHGADINIHNERDRLTPLMNADRSRSTR